VERNTVCSGHTSISLSPPGVNRKRYLDRRLTGVGWALGSLRPLAALIIHFSSGHSPERVALAGSLFLSLEMNCYGNRLPEGIEAQHNSPFAAPALQFQAIGHKTCEQTAAAAAHFVVRAQWSLGLKAVGTV
jgi:hypothetical protein